MRGWREKKQKANARSRHFSFLSQDTFRGEVILFCILTMERVCMVMIWGVGGGRSDVEIGGTRPIRALDDQLFHLMTRMGCKNSWGVIKCE